MNKNNFYHFKTWQGFIDKLATINSAVVDKESARQFVLGDNEFYYGTVFIKESQEIYTHGQWYDCSRERDYANLKHNEDADKVLVSTDNSFVLKDIQDLIGVTNTSKQLKFYCIEDVSVKVNDLEPVTYGANSTVNIYFKDGDTFELTTTSQNSIMTLDAWPGTLGVFYDWLEGVQMFNNIIFDMNSQDMYTKWNQANQDSYHVQKAQYTNCVFWSDNPYINDLATRTNYTLYNTFQLPLCYSTIPDNTYKPFYLAYGVKSDPNWSNEAYITSFSKTTTATAPFSYYGMGNVSIFNMGVDPIILPKDCRGLMFYSPGIERAGTFDASKTTNFGAKSGSWREAFGNCDSLKTLYIQNLKASLNLSWSPIEIDSISYIINNAINTSKITLSLSPYTWYRLTDDVISAAQSKNITLELISTNYYDDSRFEDSLTKTSQTLTDEQKDIVHQNLDLDWIEY